MVLLRHRGNLIQFVFNLRWSFSNPVQPLDNLLLKICNVGEDLILYVQALINEFLNILIVVPGWRFCEMAKALESGTPGSFFELYFNWRLWFFKFNLFQFRNFRRLLNFKIDTGHIALVSHVLDKFKFSYWFNERFQVNIDYRCFFPNLEVLERNIRNICFLFDLDNLINLVNLVNL